MRNNNQGQEEPGELSKVTPSVTEGKENSAVLVSKPTTLF